MPIYASPERIVYLFGAGSTMAEASYSGIEQSLSLRAVSELVVEKAIEDRDLADVLGNIATDDITDIEIYISLLESMSIQRYSDAASKLKSIFCDIIEDKLLLDDKTIDPILTMTLLQIHEIEEVKKIEQLTGLITVNYDSLLDQACQNVLNGVNYGIKCNCESGTYNLTYDCLPLIKLHGSFNWKSGIPSTKIDENQAKERSEMLWIPPGVEKQRERYPFNMLWGKAFELLDCDKLRIVGCSLSQNDWGLLSLLFKTQLRAERPYQIELIKSHKGGEEIRKNNGFLKEVKVLGELPNCQDLVEYKSKNVYEDWLKRYIQVFLDKHIPIDKMNLNYVDMFLGD